VEIDPGAAVEVDALPTDISVSLVVLSAEARAGCVLVLENVAVWTGCRVCRVSPEVSSVVTT
jgi:hypothetical protein